MLELSIPQLVDALSRRSLTASDRKQLLEAMGRDGGHDAVSVLVRRAAAGDADSRLEAVEVLGGMNHPAARDAVRQALHDPEGAVRIAAAAALARLAPRSGGPLSRPSRGAVVPFPTVGSER